MDPIWFSLPCKFLRLFERESTRGTGGEGQAETSVSSVPVKSLGVTTEETNGRNPPGVTGTLFQGRRLCRTFTQIVDSDKDIKVNVQKRVTPET